MRGTKIDTKTSVEEEEEEHFQGNYTKHKEESREKEPDQLGSPGILTTIL